MATMMMQPPMQQAAYGGLPLQYQTQQPMAMQQPQPTQQPQQYQPQVPQQPAFGATTQMQQQAAALQQQNAMLQAQIQAAQLQQQQQQQQQQQMSQTAMSPQSQPASPTFAPQQFASPTGTQQLSPQQLAYLQQQHQQQQLAASMQQPLQQQQASPQPQQQASGIVIGGLQQQNAGQLHPTHPQQMMMQQHHQQQQHMHGVTKREKADALKEWTTSIDLNMHKFHDASKIVVNKHQKSHIKTSAFAHALKEMSEHETCQAIKQSLTVLGGNLMESEKHRQILLGQLQAHIVEKFDKYPMKLQVQDQNIKMRNKSYSQLQSKLRDYNNARNNRKSEAKIQMSKDQLEAEMKRMHSSEETLNNSVRSFERERVEDMKKLLKRYIQGQIYFFSRSLEGLTTAYQAVSGIDADVEAERLIGQLRSTEYHGQ